MKAQNGDKEALETLVKDNMGLVYSVAKRMRLYDRVDDWHGAISEGVIGLIQSIKQFDTSRNLLFSTYSCPLIHGAMNNYIVLGHGSNRPIRVTKKYHYIINDMLKFKDKFIQNNKRCPTVEEISEGINASKKEVEKALELNDGILSLDYWVDDDGFCLADLVEDKSYEGENRIIDKMTMAQYLDRLKDKERKIIKMIYWEDVTKKDISIKFGITEGGVRMLEKRALKKLKKMMESDYQYETSMDFKKRA